MSNYNKRLEVDCDDTSFASGKIILSWQTEDQQKDTEIRVCRIDFELQQGTTAVLTFEEVENLIAKLNTVKDRLQP